MSRRAIDEHDGLGEFFDRRYRAVAGDYHRFAFSYGRRKIDERLRAVLADLRAGGRVLDVGCGTGEQLRRCADLGLQVTGVEPAARLRAAARRSVPQAEIVDALAGDLPFADASFDLAIAIEVLRYLEPADFEQSCAELVRVVEPGGVLFLTLVNRWAADGYCLYHRAQRVWAALAGGRPPLHCEFTTPRRIGDLLTRLGCDRVRAIGCMAGPLRWLYKLGIGPAAARALEPLDDRLARRAWSAPLAGHLVVVARRGSAAQSSSGGTTSPVRPRSPS